MKNTLNIPLIIYIDINYDTRTEVFDKFEDSLKRLGFNVAKSNNWTRYNTSGQNSNIDIIVYSTKLQNLVKVHFMEHIPTLSDHI